jgi:WD40 repeat protein
MKRRFYSTMRVIVASLAFSLFISNSIGQSVLLMEISEDGNYYLTSHNSHPEIYLWSSYSGKYLGTLKGLDSPAKKIYLDEQNARVIAISNQKVMGWDLSSIAVTFEWQLNERILELANNSDFPEKMSVDLIGNRIAFAPYEILVFDLSTGAQLMKLDDFKYLIYQLNFLPGKNQLIGIESISYDLFAINLKEGDKARRVAKAGATDKLVVRSDGEQILQNSYTGYTLFDSDLRVINKGTLTAFGMNANPDKGLISFQSNTDQLVYAVSNSLFFMSPGRDPSEVSMPFQINAISANNQQVMATNSESIHVTNIMGHQLGEKQSFQVTKSTQPLSTDFSITASSKNDRLMQGTASGEFVWKAGAVEKKLKAHRDPITALLQPKNSNELFSGSYGFAAKWDLEKEDLLKMYRGHSTFVHLLALSADERYLLSASVSGEIFLWDAQLERIITTFLSEDPIQKIEFTGQGIDFITTDDTGVTTLWNNEQYANELTNPPLELIVNTGHSDQIVGIQFREDGKEMLTTDMSGNMRIWDVQNLVSREVIYNDGTANASAYTPDGRSILNNNLTEIFLHDANTGKLLRKTSTPEVFNGWMFNNLAIMPSSSDAIMASIQGNALLRYEVNAGKYFYIGPTNHEFAPYQVAINPAGTDYATYGSKKITIWNLDATVKFEIENPNNSSNNIYGDYFMRYSPDGKYLGFAQNKQMRIWDLEANKEVASVEASECALGTETAFFVRTDFASNGNIEAIDLKTGQSKYKKIYKNVDAFTAIDFYEPNKLLAIGRYNGSVELFNSENGELLQSTNKFSVRKIKSTIHPVNGTIAIPFSGGIRFFDMERGDFDEVKKIPWRYGPHLIRYSPDGSKLLAESMSTVEVFDSNTLQSLGSFKGDSKSVISTDGKLLLAIDGLIDTEISVFSLATGQLINTWKLKDKTSFAYSAQFDSSNESIFVIESREGTKNATNQFGNLRVQDVYLIEFEIKSGKKTEQYLNIDWAENFTITEDGRYSFFYSGRRKITCIELLAEKPVAKVFEISHSPESFDYHSPSNSIVSTDDDGFVYFIDVETGEEKKKLRAHRGEVRSVDFYKNQMLTSGEDGKTILWDLVTYDMIAVIINLSSEDYLIIDRENHYLSTKGISGELFFKKGEEIFPFEQFDLRFNRPDRVLKNIGVHDEKRIANSKRAFDKRLKKLGLTEDMLSDNLAAPVAQWSQPLPPFSDQSKISISLAVKDQTATLDRIMVWVNNVPIFGSDGYSLKSKKTKEWSGEIDVELVGGANKVQVAILNTNGVESNRLTNNINFTGERKFPTRYIVSIGVSDYADDKFDLSFAGKDAEDLMACFQNTTEQKIIPFLLRDEQVTKANVLALRDSLMKSSPEDEVILFAAGHGILNNNLDWFYAPYDMDFYKPKSRGISYDELESILDGIPARNKLLLLDACHSGEVDEENFSVVKAKAVSGITFRGFTGEERGFEAYTQSSKVGLENSFELMQQLFSDLRRGSGAMVISAASGGELASEDANFQNGYFTYFILDGINNRRADLNKDGEISVSELRTYVADKVIEATNGLQRPTFRQQNLENNFVLWK